MILLIDGPIEMWAFSYTDCWMMGQIYEAEGNTSQRFQYGKSEAEEARVQRQGQMG